MKASVLKAVLDFVFVHANHDPAAPAGHRGVQVILDGKALSFRAVTEGATTVVEMAPQAVSGGKGRFLLSFDDIANLLPPLRSGAHLVTVARSEQPLTKKPCVKFFVGDWFEAWVGAPCTGPDRSAASHGPITMRAVKCVGRSLKPLSVGAGFSWSHDEKTNTCTLTIPDPIPGIVSVVKTIY